MDYFYYYKMLLGSVEKGYEFDKLKIRDPNSSYKLFGMNTLIRESVGDKEGKYQRSSKYIILFYFIIIVVGILFSCVVYSN